MHVLTNEQGKPEQGFGAASTQHNHHLPISLNLFIIHKSEVLPAIIQEQQQQPSRNQEVPTTRFAGDGWQKQNKQTYSKHAYGAKHPNLFPLSTILEAIF